MLVRKEVIKLAQISVVYSALRIKLAYNEANPFFFDRVVMLKHIYVYVNVNKRWVVCRVLLLQSIYRSLFINAQSIDIQIRHMPSIWQMTMCAGQM